jgi:thioredoxin 2
MSTAGDVAVGSAVVTCPNCGKKNRVPAAAQGIPRCGQCHKPLPWMVDADDETFAQVAEAATISVLVDLWAPWCGPCRMVSPALETLATERGGRLKLVKVNSDVAPRTSQRFGVQAIPTLVLLKDGEVVDKQVGAAPAPALRAWLDRAMPDQ